VRRTALALVAPALALAGCQTTAEKSAKLEKEAQRHATASTQRGLSIAHRSTIVKVLGTTVLRSSEGAVAVVTLRNTSGHGLHSVPLALTVTDARGRTLYQNNAGGLEAALVSVPSIPAHGTVVWVDDQVPPSGAPAAVTARVGEAATTTRVPEIAVAGVPLVEDPTNGVGAAGTVSNRSAVAQSSLVIFGVARRAGKLVAAGRAVIPELGAHAQLPFQLFFVGDPRGAQLQVSAPASAVG
jgi:hypothetical protein